MQEVASFANYKLKFKKDLVHHMSRKSLRIDSIIYGGIGIHIWIT